MTNDAGDPREWAVLVRCRDVRVTRAEAALIRKAAAERAARAAALTAQRQWTQAADDERQRTAARYQALNDAPASAEAMRRLADAVAADAARTTEARQGFEQARLTAMRETRIADIARRDHRRADAALREVRDAADRARLVQEARAEIAAELEQEELPRPAHHPILHG